MTLYNALPHSKIDLLIQQNEKFLILSEETIDTGYTRFYAIVTSLKYLDKDDPNKNHVRKFLCALLLKWCPKVIAIKEAEDLAELPLNDLIDNFKVYEMVLEINGVISKSTKEKVKSLAFKAKVTRGQDSNDSEKSVGSSRREHSCYGCGNKNYFIDDCPKAKVKKEFVGGALSDCEDGDQIEKDTTCLMVISSQQGYFGHFALHQPPHYCIRLPRTDATVPRTDTRRARGAQSSLQYLVLTPRTATVPRTDVSATSYLVPAHLTPMIRSATHEYLEGIALDLWIRALEKWGAMI
ncbi:hypothetical protein Tco_0233868 [Tanacetum coccineum]